MVTASPRLRLPRARAVAGVEVRVWANKRSRRPLPLLVVHDGPEYVRRAALLDVLAQSDLPPIRAALIESPARHDDFSASAEYSRRLVRRILPALPPAGPVVGVGASLGALALLHAHLAAPGTFAALFLQSGSYFRCSTDPQERRFPRFVRITRFVERVELAEPVPIAVTMTCGVDEENLANNRLMRDTLLRHGYDVGLHEVRGGHDWRVWRDGLDPYLLALVRATAG